MTLNLLLVLGFGYGVLLFVIASYSDRLARRGRAPWLQTPIVYTLSLAIYCTAWTLFGAVGSAARNGFEFLAIYIGPSIAFFAWWILLRKMVEIGKQHNITSIADFISSRFGKSGSIAVLVTLIALLATGPYISLQLQSITQGIAAFAPPDETGNQYRGFAFLAAIALAAFAILFGTRHALVNERHHGVIAAIAVEGVVKLVAMLVVGGVVVYEFGGFDAVFATPEGAALLAKPVFTTRWFGLVSISFMAVLVLPRMFHVLVVENQDESQLATASWAFPLYLLALNIFVLPIAIVGLNMSGAGVNPDYFVVSVPLSLGHPFVAYLGFLGGFSAATSMIIVTTIAVSTMISNHIILPIWLDARGNQQNPDDVRIALLRIRRVLIVAIMLLSFIYFDRSGTSQELSSIGLVAFVGVAQLFPALMAALFWRGATRIGVGVGMLAGTLTWFYVLYLPRISQGEFGALSSMLQPDQILPVVTGDLIIDTAIWSIGTNSLLMFLLSMVSMPRPLERLQANSFYYALDPNRGASPLHRTSTLQAHDFATLTQRILGAERTRYLFIEIAAAQNRHGELPAINDVFFEKLERALGGVIGAAMAHALISQITDQTTVPTSETIKLIDETIQNLEYARALERQRQELEETAEALRGANASLVALNAQRDAFLSQISHELRTPMTAMRSFTDLLSSQPPPSPSDQKRMLEIMANENERLTKLLDEILDISYLESGRISMASQPIILQDALQTALDVTQPVWSKSELTIDTQLPKENVIVHADYDRLLQVFINLITNAAKYVRAEQPNLVISVQRKKDIYAVEFADNGAGIPANAHDAIFEKFSRGAQGDAAGSAGLGLAISREIATNLGGNLELLPTSNGATFRLSLPVKAPADAAIQTTPAQ